MSEVFNKKCFWCNRTTDYPPTNGISFCWQSYICPFEICGEILEKIDTIDENYECPVCMEIKTVLEMPRCSHKVCLDCYKTIYFGISELEKPDIYDLNFPEWTYEKELDEDGEIMENKKENEHDNFLREKMAF